MPKPKDKCPVGHKMNTENTYWQRKHGNTYAVCRTCKRLASKNGRSFSTQEVNSLGLPEVLLSTKTQQV